MEKLSVKQRNILNFIGGFIEENGYPPAIRDIVGGCKISSTSVVDYNMKILQKMGYIRRHAEVSRGIELIDPKKKAGHILVPVVGQIAAGQPIEVPEDGSWNTDNSSESIAVTEDLTHGKKDVYALRVKGNSMIEDLINDGDIVLMQYVNTVENGETAAVWLKEEKEVTLKKFYAEKNKVRLQPANSQMSPIVVDARNVAVQGRIISVIRNLT